MPKSFVEKHQFLIGVIIVLVFFVGLWQFYLKDTAFFSMVLPSGVPLEPEKTLYTYNVELSVLPSLLCAGGFVIGTITSNIPNGSCTIFVNTGTGFQALVDIVLNSNGFYQTSQRIGTIGTAILRAVCCDAQKNCKVSNDVDLTVTTAIPPCIVVGPDFDGDGIPDSIDTDDDNDGYSDEQELEDGTDPLNPNEYDNYYTPSDCAAICDDAGFSSGRKVNSASECSGTEVFQANANASVLCCCTPYAEQNPNLCDGAIVPTGTGDAGAWCAAKTGCDSFNGTQKVCDNYWNSITQQMKCGCVTTFWCQENYTYTATGNNCVCPPHTQYQWITSTQFKCIT